MTLRNGEGGEVGGGVVFSDTASAIFTVFPEVFAQENAENRPKYLAPCVRRNWHYDK